MRLAGKIKPRTFDIFVGGVHPSFSSDDLYSYIKSELNVKPIKVENNRSNEYNRSFKVTVNVSDKQIFFDPAHWEVNIIIKPFRNRRSYQPQAAPHNIDANWY